MHASAADSWLTLQVLRENRLRVHLPNDRCTVGWKSPGHPGVQTWAGDPWPRQWRLFMETGMQKTATVGQFDIARLIFSYLWRLFGTSSNICLGLDVVTVQLHNSTQEQAEIHDGNIYLWTNKSDQSLSKYEWMTLGPHTAADYDHYKWNNINPPSQQRILCSLPTTNPRENWTCDHKQGEPSAMWQKNQECCKRQAPFPRKPPNCPIFQWNQSIYPLFCCPCLSVLLWPVQIYYTIMQCCAVCCLCSHSLIWHITTPPNLSVFLVCLCSELQVSHTFNDYGPGISYISFEHGGQDTKFWDGWFGVRVTGSSVTVEVWT